MNGLKSINRTTTIALAAGVALPTAFRLFKSGWNTTENGNFLFDAAAARSVMAAHNTWGVDLAIDLDHQMIDGAASADPTARDARGWCRLELRGGELWAVGVTWTADGAARLRDKRQRYISPAFSFDPETKRVIAIVNVALTALPATHKTPALMAASRNLTTMMNAAQNPTAVPLPADKDAALVAIIKALGLTDKADGATITSAFGALMGALGKDTDTSGDPAAASLSARELAICKETGCTPTGFLAARRFIQRRDGK